MFHTRVVCLAWPGSSHRHSPAWSHRFVRLQGLPLIYPLLPVL
jgi:hypothetical protein